MSQDEALRLSNHLKPGSFHHRRLSPTPNRHLFLGHPVMRPLVLIADGLVRPILARTVTVTPTLCRESPSPRVFVILAAFILPTQQVSLKPRHLIFQRAFQQSNVDLASCSIAHLPLSPFYYTRSRCDLMHLIFMNHQMGITRARSR